MPRLELDTFIRADPSLCFDLSRDIDLHTRSLGHTGERAIAGRTSGLICLNEEVTWEGRHFGLLLRHTSRITAFDPPRHFRDEMTKGHFKSFRHDHFFEAAKQGTKMRDVLEFESPAGFVGRAVNALVLSAHMRKLLQVRNRLIKTAAEERAGTRGPDHSPTS